MFAVGVKKFCINSEAGLLGGEIMKVFEWHSELAERLRLKLGWSHYAVYWVSFIKGVAVTCLVYWLV